MRNAVILDYSDGEIVILPIPEDIAPEREDSFVRMHPAYDSDECSYMIVEGNIEISKVISDQPIYFPIATLTEESLQIPKRNLLAYYEQ